MSTKTLLKFAAAFVLLAAVLIFLGVNFVPRIFASSSSQRNTVVDVNQSYILHSHYNNSQYPRAILDPRIPQANTLSVYYYVGSDWIERHPVQPAQLVNYVGSDWIERHPIAVTQLLNNVGSDWIERHPSNFYSNSDWIERHP